MLVLYGIIPTFQPAHFGRVYAAYGGVFIVLSLLWGWMFDGNRPDRLDVDWCDRESGWSLHHHVLAKMSLSVELCLERTPKH